MLINRMPLYFVIGICALAVYGLFYIKDKVSTLRIELTEVKKQINLEHDTIHLLKAEVAYLASPERLKKFADSYLDLKITEVNQMIKDPSNYHMQYSEPKLTNVQTHKVKWRYKKAPSKYVTKVSHTKLTK